MRMHYRKKIPHFDHLDCSTRSAWIDYCFFNSIAEISTWYSTLNHSPLTPPNYVFPSRVEYFVQCHWGLRMSNLAYYDVASADTIKTLYVTQLILNWSWSPLFFYFHLIKTSRLILILMDIIVGMLILLAYPKIKTVSLLMIPYLLWILIATYI
ncbi:TspO/MBR family protein [Candidatus Rickettsia kedanie]|uniref:TspO/MBR family protein n=1 Tax=Candidatus Rickettsia kedanie TaxID=3115352 RepID=UPI00399D3025